MSCQTCGKIPKFREEGTQLLFCNENCQIGLRTYVVEPDGKRKLDNDDENIIGLVGNDSLERIETTKDEVQTLKTIVDLIEKAGTDNVIEIQFPYKTLRMVMAYLKNNETVPEESKESLISLLHALNYLGYVNIRECQLVQYISQNLFDLHIDYNMIDKNVFRSIIFPTLPYLVFQEMFFRESRAEQFKTVKWMLNDRRADFELVATAIVRAMENNQFKMVEILAKTGKIGFNPFFNAWTSRFLNGPVRRLYYLLANVWTNCILLHPGTTWQNNYATLKGKLGPSNSFAIYASSLGVAQEGEFETYKMKINVEVSNILDSYCLFGVISEAIGTNTRFIKTHDKYGIVLDFSSVSRTDPIIREFLNKFFAILIDKLGVLF